MPGYGLGHGAQKDESYLPCKVKGLGRYESRGRKGEQGEGE